MDLTGIWTNELRSVMVLRTSQEGDNLSGTYHSIVGRDPGYRNLAGRTSPEDGAKQMVGFTVVFYVDEMPKGYGHYTVCAWSGWAEAAGSAQLIRTHWLLTENIFDRNSEWASTN